jgi:hypothetical protein
MLTWARVGGKDIQVKVMDILRSNGQLVCGGLVRNGDTTSEREITV